MVSEESFSLSEMFASEGAVVRAGKGLLGGRVLDFSVVFSPVILMETEEGRNKYVNHRETHSHLSIPTLQSIIKCMPCPLHVCDIDTLWVQIQVQAEIQYADLDNKSSYKIEARDRSGRMILKTSILCCLPIQFLGFSKHLGSEGWRKMGKDASRKFFKTFR